MKVAKLMSLGLVFVIVLFQLVGCSTFTAAFEPKQAAKEYMRNLTTGDLEKVFEQVAYFDKGSDLEPEISFADAKQAWIDRVQRLKENGTYVKSYSNLKTWLDDGYPRGHVTLTVFYNGKETVQQKRPIHFARLHGKWKIQNIRLTDDSEGNDFQRALSGFMPPKKLDERTTVFQVNHLEFLNPRDPRKIATGERVKSQPDYSNILLESDRGSRALLQAGTFKELQQKVFEAARYKGEDKPILYFAVDPMPVNEGKQIVYVSNKETVLRGPQAHFSVYIINGDGNGERLLVDGARYEDPKILDTLNDQVFMIGLDKDSLLVTNAVTGETKEYAIQGLPDAISKDGTHVLFRKVKENYVLSELWLLQLSTGKETRIGDVPQDYYFNKGGSK